MENKIEVGEYIRTNNGIIAKLERIKSELRYKYWANNGKCYTEKAIKKHSFNIEDLLEKGDYVNRHRIDEIKNGYIYCEECEGIYNYITDKINNNDKIVTKEQFKSVEYEV